jgi:hypothetical protein
MIYSLGAVDTRLLHKRQEFWIHPEFKSRHAKTLVKLSRSSTRYPDRLVLKGVEIKGYPVASGGFGDVYKGQLGNHDLAVKVLKVKKRREIERLRKVNFAALIFHVDLE